MTLADNPVFLGFILFCRIGGCLMAAPGFSSERIPMRSRLYLAIAVAMALGPPLMEQLHDALSSARPASFAAILLSELIVGVTLGLLSRFYFFALETLTTSVAMTFGLGNIFGAPVAEAESAPALASFVVTCAVTLLFVGDLHLEIIRGVYLSYEAAPVSVEPAPSALLDGVMHVLTEAHLLALRICSPFLLFGLIMNVALGFLARLTPQVQIYFISGPLTIFLGLYVFSLLAQDALTAFTSHFGAWLLRG